MATHIADFREPIRAYLLDTHPDFKQFHADQIDAAVRLVVNMGKIPDVTIDEYLGDALSEEIESGTLNWARIVLYAAQRFVLPTAQSFAFRTRELSERFGDKAEAVRQLMREVYELEHGVGGE